MADVQISVAEGLRRVADWLDDHPEARPGYSWVTLATTTREDLEAVARALDGHVVSLTKDESFGAVVIRGEFPGCVAVRAEVPTAEIAEVQPRPAYKPILSVLRDA